MRDLERQATYLAEGEAFADTPMAEALSFERAAALITEIVAHAWWRARGCDPSPVTVVEGRSAHTSWWRATDRRVQLSPADLRIATVTHELAHAADAGRNAGTAGPAHGPGFRRAHVDVVALVAGRVPSDQLLAAYRADGLEVAAADAVSRVADALTVLDPRPFNLGRRR